MTSRRRVFGLVINPIAGVGGPLARWGSDSVIAGESADHHRATENALGALAVVARDHPGSVILTVAGAMGADAIERAGLRAEVVMRPGANRTTGSDTTAAVDAIVGAGANLVLFVGGDGTARDVARAKALSDTHDADTAEELTRAEVAVLGVPAGVKMYSSCFATTPRAAGAVASMWLGGATIARRDAEVLDVDEDALRRGEAIPTLYALVPIPDVAGRTQSRKAPTPASQHAEVEQAVDGFLNIVRPGVRYLLGPGGTMKAIARRLGLHGSDLGVDVLLDGMFTVVNATEQELIDEVAKGPSHVVVTVIGGQGFVLGRGNQQISPAVIRSLQTPRLIVVASQRKLVDMGGAPLLVHTGDAEIDQSLTGYVSVITGLHDRSLYRVVSPDATDRDDPSPAAHSPTETPSTDDRELEHETT